MFDISIDRIVEGILLLIGIVGNTYILYKIFCCCGIMKDDE